jgi:GNAT superfamily N-acetyltransferase
MSVFHSLDADDQKLFLNSMGAGPGEEFDQEGGVAVELRPLKPSDYSWLLDGLITGGRSLGWGGPYIAKCARTVLEFIEQPYGPEEHGWVAHRFQVPVGASLLILNEDTTCAELAALFVVPRARSLGIGSSLLEASIGKAKELTMLAVTATASGRQDDIDRLLRKYGFKRGQASEPEYTYGKQEVWRDYRLNLPILAFGMAGGKQR